MSICNSRIYLDKMIELQEAGWLDYQHCDCDVCELLREENNINFCKDKSCQGCKNLASGKKIFNWYDYLDKRLYQNKL